MTGVGADREVGSCRVVEIIGVDAHVRTRRVLTMVLMPMFRQGGER